MNDEILRRIHHTNQSAHAQVLEYFEQLKVSDNGWELCAQVLLSGQYLEDEQIRFFCYQVIENFVAKKYSSHQDSATKQKIRNFLVNIMQMVAGGASAEKGYVKNKLAQLVSLVFVVDYPTVWPTFYTDMMQFAKLGGQEATDLYLRILKAIDVEVVDREVLHTVEEQTRNTNIKDYMREQCIVQLVDSWYDIMSTYEGSHPQLVCSCLEVVGLYVAWIDINLIANDRMVPILIRYINTPLLRESACEAVTEILHKGMEPEAKVKLIESFTSVLESAGVMYPSEDEEGDFVLKLSKLVNCMGENLVLAWDKSVKAARGAVASGALLAVEGKVSIMCRFLGDEDDDVSSTVCPFAMSYIGILKRLKPLSDKQKENVQNIMMIVLKKFEFDEDYDFDEEGEDEAMFQDYRKTLKMLFCSIAKMDPTLMLIIVRQMLSSCLETWRQVDFRKVEVALLLVYMLGEALPAQQNQHFRDDTKESQEKAEALKEMLKMIIMSEVSHHTHQAVTLQFFETVVRYEKFYHHQPECIPAVLSAFLDERGLRNPRSRVRSRVSYLFTRFIKAVRGNLHQYTENILKQMEGLLTLNTPHSNTIVNGIQPNAAGDTQSWLTNEEQMFLYEVASQLIVNSNLSAQRKSSLMMALLTPVIQDFQTVFNKLCQETDEAVQQSYADCLNCAMSFASRASKGFSNQATMKTCACIPVFTSCLDMFIQALNSPFQRATLQQGVRQFFHRMIVCLEEDILPFVPVMVRLMLETPDAKELYDFIPMLNQLVTKFKVTLAPFLQEAFTPLVTTIYTVLNSPIDSLDTVTMSDRKLLRRGYFTFIANLITSNLTQVIKNQDGATVEQVLTTVIQGCSDLPDPSSQKVCFNILKNLVEQWTNSEDGIMGFDEFTRKNIVPACILAPTKESFDWRDAQTVLLLGDIAGCLHTIYTKQKEVLVQWLVNQYFPSLQLDPSISQSFCTSLTADQKKLKDYLKSFYSNLRDGR